ncbi:MAG: PD-(D/E)XK nuclease family protein [Planctomycetota bacterium]
MTKCSATLYLYPSALARDTALSALPAATWSGSHLTFSEFTQRLDRQLPIGVETVHRRLSDAARQMIFAQTLKELDEDARERLSGADAALSAWVELYAAWKGAGLTPLQVCAAARQLPKNADIKDILDLLGRFFEAYERLLGPGWLDQEDYEWQIRARLEKCVALPARVLPTGTAVEARAFHRLIPFQRYVLEKLATLGHPVRIYEPAAFTAQSFRDTYGALRDTVISPKIRPPREYLRIEAATPYAEVYEIGRRVHEWIAQDRIAPTQIGVAFRNLGPYSQAISDVFNRFEIPFYERRGEPLAFQPLIRVALSAVDACVTGLNRRDLFRFLCAGPVNIAGLARLTLQVETRPNALHDLAREARIDCFFGPEAAQPAAAWRKRLHRFPADDRRKTLLAIIERLAAMNVTRSLAAHADAWRHLFSDASLTPQALLLNDRIENRSSNLQKDQRALTQLYQALDEIAESPDHGDVSLDEFARCLKLSIQPRTLQAAGGEIGGVRVLNLYDLRGLSFERLVIGGMIEGVLPAPPTGNPLIGVRSASTIRNALAAQLDDKTALLHIEPRLPDECREEEQALFEIARTCAADGILTFTRPRADADGNPLSPSVFWNTIESAVETAAAIHPAPALTQCITTEERQLRHAWTLGGGVDGKNDDILPSAAAYCRSKSLQSIAGRAAVERARQIFFAQPPPSVEEETETKKVSPLQSLDEKKAAQRPPGDYDGVVTAQAPEASETLAKLLLSPMSHAARAVLADRSKTSLSVTEQLSLFNEPPTTDSTPAISPSALEDLAGCRFRFLNSTIFKFRETVKPETAISSRDCGTLWHNTLAEFYREQLHAARNAGKLVARLEEDKRKIYLDQLQEIADRILKRAPDRMFTGHPALFKLEEEKISGALSHWLDHELQRQQIDGFYPTQVEFEFGPTAPASAVAVPFADGDKMMLLEGRMDRLDFQIANPDDACPEVSAVRIIDYKLGGAKNYSKNITSDALKTLLSAQLPIYLKAALEYLAALEKDGKVRVAWPQALTESQAGYYCLRELPIKKTDKKDAGLVIIKDWPLGDLQKFLCDAPIQAGSLFATVKDKVTKVLRGDFAAQPKACSGIWCGSRFACRYQAVQGEPDVTLI